MSLERENPVERSDARNKRTDSAAAPRDDDRFPWAFETSTSVAEMLNGSNAPPAEANARR